MIQSTRVAAIATAAAIGLSSFGAPAMAATSTSTHWTKAQCHSWEKSFAKRNPKASSKRKAAGNKVLKGKGCTIKIK
jgi:hypothetical protein